MPRDHGQVVLVGSVDETWGSEGTVVFTATRGRAARTSSSDLHPLQGYAPAPRRMEATEDRSGRTEGFEAGARVAS